MKRLDNNSALVRLNSLIDKIEEFRNFGTDEHLDFPRWRNDVQTLLSRQLGENATEYKQFAKLDFSRASEEYMLMSNRGDKFRKALAAAEALLETVAGRWRHELQEENMAMPSENQEMAPRIFISHAGNEDSDIANLLRQWLMKEYNLAKEEIFVSSSPDSIRSDDFWLTKIGKALRSCSKVLVLLTHSSVEKRWVLFEVGAAYGCDKLLPPLLCKGLKTADLPNLDPISSIQVKDTAVKEKFAAFISEIDNALHFTKEHDSKSKENLRLALKGEHS